MFSDALLFLRNSTKLKACSSEHAEKSSWRVTRSGELTWGRAAFNYRSPLTLSTHPRPSHPSSTMIITPTPAPDQDPTSAGDATTRRHNSVVVYPPSRIRFLRSQYRSLFLPLLEARRRLSPFDSLPPLMKAPVAYKMALFPGREPRRLSEVLVFFDTTRYPT